MKTPLERVREISEKYCADYPNIENCATHERLYAIESSLEGISQANTDCHKMISILAEKLCLSADDVCKLWEDKIG